jgi:hypothetical protein
MKRMKKADRKDKILNFIIQKPRTWADIKKYSVISTGSMSNYLKEWINNRMIRKTIINNEVYYEAFMIPRIAIEKMKADIKKAIADLKELKELGLFSKGFNDKEILDYLNSVKEDFGWKEGDYKYNSLTLEFLLGFIAKISDATLFNSNIKIKANLKVEEDPDKLIKEFESILKRKH